MILVLVLSDPQRIGSDTQTAMVAAGCSNFLMTAVLGVLFISWVYRASTNALALGAVDMRFDPVWSVLWWFIPLYSVFRPLQVVKELWQASDPETRYPVPLTAGPSPWWITAWWVLFLLGSCATSLHIETARQFPEAHNGVWRSFAVAAIVIAAARLISACLAIRLIWSIHGRQEARQAALVKATPSVVEASNDNKGTSWLSHLAQSRPGAAESSAAAPDRTSSLDQT